MDSNFKINHNMLLSYISQTSEGRNSYFLHWYFDWKSCFVVFFHEWNEWKNPQFNFSSQDLSIERNFFKWDGKVTKISHLLFHRIWKKNLPAVVRTLTDSSISHQRVVSPFSFFSFCLQRPAVLVRVFDHISDMLDGRQPPNTLALYILNNIAASSSLFFLYFSMYFLESGCVVGPITLSPRDWRKVFDNTFLKALPLWNSVVVYLSLEVAGVFKILGSFSFLLLSSSRGWSST